MAQIGNSLPTGFRGPANKLKHLVACAQSNLQVLWHWQQCCARSVLDAIRSCIQFTGFTAPLASLEITPCERWIAREGLAASEIALGSSLNRCNDARAEGLIVLQVATKHPWERMI